jgi:hypothetical protein
MKKYRSEKEWRDLFAEQKESGKNAKQFCRVKSVNANVFYRKKKLLENNEGLVRLPMGMVNRTPVEIAMGGVTIVVRSGVAEQELIQVLRCVREALDA